jgi:hypothetical protein
MIAKKWFRLILVNHCSPMLKSHDFAGFSMENWLYLVI